MQPDMIELTIFPERNTPSQVNMEEIKAAIQASIPNPPKWNGHPDTLLVHYEASKRYQLMLINLKQAVLKEWKRRARELGPLQDSTELYEYLHSLTEKGHECTCNFLEMCLGCTEH